MAWQDILGQTQVVNVLSQAVAKDQVMHAYLFTGEKGLGKRYLAKTFASYLLAENKADHSEHLQTCDMHPDFHCIEPDGASLKIGQIRELQKSLYTKPYQAGYKIYLITEIEKMTTEAANSLLKALEEPPTDVIFLLTANSIAGILPTVISRCQVFRLQPVPVAELTAFLQSQKGAATDQVQTAVNLAKGNPGRALQLLTTDDTLREDSLVMLGKILRGGDCWQLAEEAEAMLNQGELLEYFYLYLRDLLLYKETGNGELLINIDKQVALVALANELTVNELLQFLTVLEEAKQMLTRNVNARMLLERMLLEINAIRAK